jgi:hypothetical protein
MYWRARPAGTIQWSEQTFSFLLPGMETVAPVKKAEWLPQVMRLRNNEEAQQQRPAGPTRR